MPENLLRHHLKMKAFLQLVRMVTGRRFAAWPAPIYCGDAVDDRKATRTEFLSILTRKFVKP